MTQPGSPSILSRLEPAIDRRPLTVEPSLSLADAIAIMAKAQSSCTAPSLNLPLEIALKNQARASVVWVVEGSQLVGQFTEQEALAAIASGRDLSGMALADGMGEIALAVNPADLPDSFAVLALLRQQQLRHLPMVDEQGHFSGMATIETLRAALQLDHLLKALPLADAMLAPGLQAPATAAIAAVAQQMVATGQDSVMLWGEAEANPQWVGLLLAQDVLQLEMLGLDLNRTQAQAVMRPTLPNFAPEEKVLVAYWHMQQQQAQRCLVMQAAGDLAGQVTFTSFLTTLDLDLLRGVELELQESIQTFANRPSPKASDPLSGATASPDGIEGLREQLESSQLLAAMAMHIRESLQISEILQTAVDEVRQFLQTERVLIYRFNPDMSGTVVVESVADGWQPALNSTVRDACFGKNYAHAYKEGRTQVVDDIYTAGLTQCHIDILVIYDVRASLVVPILQGDHLWGLLCAYHCSAPKHWRTFEVELLKQLATHIAIAIQQSELYEQIQSELAERKRAEEQLKSSLREKEALIKEIHHRVKNNLQIISSVLRLQSDFVRDKKVMALFNDSQNRIRSMALIHEKLYQSRDLLRISMAEYVQDLAHNLLSSYVASSQRIQLQIQAESIWLNIDTAIPCGLIINELVSNALKHAFPDPHRSDNHVWVTMRQRKEGDFTLIVRDNGIGLPTGLDFKNTESLGLELVCIFTEQLEGSIELADSEGTQFVVTFNEIGDLARDT
ncbi:histidine kinase dimerization/phosphoacceptor domain -containing protein [Pseudanabaena sp. FACHB-2040]|uniref:histidine kinase dimerization/phosphoacceptor domain -containing protein n=1 Tax=Pseudanabaena sp. FACHB-2040 TaxID=2692859 RepID=UPI001688BED4|nr:histidine kinase dimerization/phosphoacceptor domain -containing protein [Pseudanabaena sp. FACHB-2040]MBD2257880.1 GAF domain-containing protein [Pseudanabaena sp. FACHB-2040]